MQVGSLCVQEMGGERATAVDGGGGRGGGAAHVRLRQDYLRIATETDDDFFFLAWPIKIVHHIDDASPLWDLSPEALLVSGFEIVVILEACCEATGATTQVQCRLYLHWGPRHPPSGTGPLARKFPGFPYS